MSTEAWLLVLAGLACVAVVCVATGARLRGGARTDAWLPPELKGQRLAYVERTFRSDGDVQVVARVDRAYRNGAGVITLVELKSRTTDRVWSADIVELSAQRVALAGETGEPVAGIGWVVVQSAVGRTAHRVSLLSQDAVHDLVSRRADLLAGVALPRYPATRGLCASCAYRRRCDSTESRDT
ncbi:PD-(D/E)XK nuclease family protein [Methylibium petroleiphilum]|uniref:PD-(D/E)XK nuclease family protein n=1 Tax=Methylibium petroleiphilum TaxID=105560 RepID=UPI001AD07DB9|nr:PD-(D/E)XK nuclease family protein [Methylibium petroleiphilum]